MPFDPNKFITRFGGWTESYFFYNGTIELRYDPKAHVYLLVTKGDLEPQAGVTSVCHIIDKSEALIPWACKMMAQKLLKTMPSSSSLTVPSVMPIPWSMFEELVNAAKSAHKDHLEDAGEVGHVAHAWIEKFIKLIIAWDDMNETTDVLKEAEAYQEITDHRSCLFPFEERAKNCCIAALEWMSCHNVRWLCTERKIYSRMYKYAGTMDGLCRVSSCNDPTCCPHPFTDRLSVADWKTSNYLYPEYLLQTAAYQLAYEEETGEKVQDRWVIRLGKDDAEFETWHMEHDDFREDISAFLTALSLYKHMNSIRDRIKYRLDRKRKAQKASTKAAKEEALKLACKNATKYKGVRKPTCNRGNPCVSCLEKYAEKHPPKGDTSA